jgi:multicomponent Na+:H+ antiporter subunit E
MTYLPGLMLAMAALWFALSGLFSPQFLVLAAASVLLCVWLIARLRIIDRDASPYHRAPHIAAYMLWLIWQIIRSNVAVLARILGPRSALDPAMISLSTSARSDVGKAFFANSITLTPGTVTVDVDGDRLKVHALVRANAAAESFAPMDRRVSGAVDPKRRER